MGVTLIWYSRKVQYVCIVINIYFTESDDEPKQQQEQEESVQVTYTAIIMVMYIVALLTHITSVCMCEAICVKLTAYVHT